MITLVRNDFHAAIGRVLEDRYKGHAPQKVQAEILTAILDIIKQQLCLGKPVCLRNYGLIHPKIKPGGREVRNPKTMEPIVMHDTVGIRYRNSMNKTVNASSFNTGEITTALRPTLDRLGLPYYLARYLVSDGFISLIRLTMDGSHRAEIRMFGVFKAATHKATDRARNPKTGETLTLDAYQAPMFKPSRFLTREVSQHLLTIQGNNQC